MLTAKFGCFRVFRGGLGGRCYCIAWSAIFGNYVAWELSFCLKAKLNNDMGPF